MNGLCYKGEKDPLCEGIPNGERYDGMENKADGRQTVCLRFTGYEAVKLYECLPFIDDDAHQAPQQQQQQQGAANNEMTVVSPEIAEAAWGQSQEYVTIQEHGGSSSATNHGNFHQVLIAFATFAFSWLLI